jgi:hypothetical protein
MIAVKAARVGKRIFSSTITNEANNLKKIANVPGDLNKYVPKYLG